MVFQASASDTLGVVGLPSSTGPGWAGTIVPVTASAGRSQQPGVAGADVRNGITARHGPHGTAKTPMDEFEHDVKSRVGLAKA
ncbi:hypothetical protein ABZ840_08615 [Streptomyces sp. NPDC047117]|uniref:hypothetical protein n=1 Tax=Streptomyces sp. NPDC047117 TaxID=3155379 RepID=UPI0034116D87